MRTTKISAIEVLFVSLPIIISSLFIYVSVGLAVAIAGKASVNTFILIGFLGLLSSVLRFLNLKNSKFFKSTVIASVILYLVFFQWGSIIVFSVCVYLTLLDAFLLGLFRQVRPNETINLNNDPRKN
mgnify:CR=1 FL=1